MTSAGASWVTQKGKSRNAASFSQQVATQKLPPEGKENLKEDPEEDEEMIEVTGLKQSIDYDFLKLYFESKRKSGGGEIETMKRDSKSGAISITFKVPSG